MRSWGEELVEVLFDRIVEKPNLYYKGEKLEQIVRRPGEALLRKIDVTRD